MQVKKIAGHLNISHYHVFYFPNKVSKEVLLQQCTLKTENEQIKEKVNKLEGNLLQEINKLGVSKFDYKITAEPLDQLVFFYESFQNFHC
jgi:hypothetical protein